MSTYKDINSLVSQIILNIKQTFPNLSIVSRKLLLNTADSLNISRKIVLDHWINNKEVMQASHGKYYLEGLIKNTSEIRIENNSVLKKEEKSLPVLENNSVLKKEEKSLPVLENNYVFKKEEKSLPSMNFHTKVDIDVPEASKVVTAEGFSQKTYIPKIDPTYIGWGNYTDLNKIISSGEFFPVYIHGMSGNGKSLMVENICAKQKREYIRVQMTPETHETDLLGGWMLLNGNTVWMDGPIVTAMRNGAIVLLDEIDRASGKLMALQGVLEGKPVLLKKTGEVVIPKPGFNIIATANTRGRGSYDGRYTFSIVIDEALLERFAITMEQDFPSKSILTRILERHITNNDSENFVDNLVAWSDLIYSTFKNGGVDDYISVRRIVQLAKTYRIFKNKKKTIMYGTARFDEINQQAFIDLFQKVTNIDIKVADISNTSFDNEEAAAQAAIDRMPY